MKFYYTYPMSLPVSSDPNFFLTSSPSPLPQCTSRLLACLASQVTTSDKSVKMEKLENLWHNLFKKKDKSDQKVKELNSQEKNLRDNDEDKENIPTSLDKAAPQGHTDKTGEYI